MEFKDITELNDFFDNDTIDEYEPMFCRMLEKCDSIWYTLADFSEWCWNEFRLNILDIYGAETYPYYSKLWLIDRKEAESDSAIKTEEEAELLKFVNGFVDRIKKIVLTYTTIEDTI